MALRDMDDVRREADCLRSAEEVDAALSRMAQEITERLEGTNPVGFCIMNGGLFMTGKLVDKIHHRKAPGVKADFVGLRVEDRFLFGCGMDIAGYWRNLPALYAMKEKK
jgi:hypoxanthine-guanine phosphoribosyltransferase